MIGIETYLAAMHLAALPVTSFLVVVPVTDGLFVRCDAVDPANCRKLKPHLVSFATFATLTFAMCAFATALHVA